VIDRYGEVALTYAKVHTCDFDREAALTPGAGFVVAPLDTAHGPVQIGAMICYDREFPESARVLMLQGAEILLVPNSCAMERNRLDEPSGAGHGEHGRRGACQLPGPARQRPLRGLPPDRVRAR